MRTTKNEVKRFGKVIISCTKICVNNKYLCECVCVYIYDTYTHVCMYEFEDNSSHKWPLMWLLPARKLILMN